VAITDGRFSAGNPCEGQHPASRRDWQLLRNDARGRANRAGTVFKITSTGVLTALYIFCSQSDCADGGGSVAGLVQGSNGNFHGTAAGA
jgi:hypothetical protein